MKSINPTSQTLTFCNVAELFRQEHWPTLQPNTLRGYNTSLKCAEKYFNSILIKEITSKNVETYLHDYSLIRFKGAAPATKTVRNRLLLLNMLFKFACKEGFLVINPAQIIRVPRNLEKKERALPTKLDVQAIQDNINAPFGLFFYLALYTGCRRGELLALQWKDVDFTQRYISITKSVYYEGNRPFIKQPKTAKGVRKVVLLDKTFDALMAVKGNPDDYLFAEENGELLKYKTVLNSIKKFREISKTNVCAHSLRHYFCTECFECGLDVKVTQLLMGHSDVSTTLNIYTHIKDELLLREAQKLNTIDF